jgi:hypothetical protein
MSGPKKQWTLIRKDDQILDKYGNFFSQGERFSGYPKPLLRKVEEKIEE